MDFMSNILERFAEGAEGEQVAEEDAGKPAPKHGPATYRYQTAGQARRAAERAKQTEVRKTNARYRRRWMAKQQAKAVLRGQLQAIGALPYATDFVAPPSLRIRAGSWIMQHFGERDHEGNLILEDAAFQRAVERGLEQWKAA